MYYILLSYDIPNTTYVLHTPSDRRSEINTNYMILPEVTP
jgi:hypothetical protein